MRYATHKKNENVKCQFVINELTKLNSSLTAFCHSSFAVPQWPTTNVPRVVSTPQYMSELYHGVETARGTFVVGHRGTEDEEQYKRQNAVSELFSFVNYQHFTQ